MTVQNLPYWCLIWIGIGFAMILVSVLLLADLHAKNHERETYLGQVFPYMMEEQQFQARIHQKEDIKQQVYEQIDKLSQEGLSPEEIAKQLQIGIGEVKLMLSLYGMR